MEPFVILIKPQMKTFHNIFFHLFSQIAFSQIAVQFFPIHAILDQLLKALNHSLFVFLIGNTEPLVLCFTSSLPLSHSTSLLRCLLLTAERCAKFRAATVQGQVCPYTALFYFTDRRFARVSYILREYIISTRCLASVFLFGEQSSHCGHTYHSHTVMKARSALTT